MEKVRLTDAKAASAELPSGKTDHVIWDADQPGFGLRIRPQGKTFIIGFRPAGTGRAGRFKRMKIATWPTVGTKDARQIARAALGKVAGGVDPLGERREAKLRAMARVADLLTRYEEHLAKRGYVNRVMVMNGLRSRLEGLLGRDIESVTGQELSGIIERLENAGKPGAAQDFRSRMRAFISWCLSIHVLKSNPLANYRKQKRTREDRLRDEEEGGRALTNRELVTVWRNAQPDTSFHRYIRFLILTGCRRGEGAQLTWGMVNEATQWISLPSHGTKQGRPLLLPIHKPLSDMLAECPVGFGSQLVFPSSKTGGPMSGFTKMLDNLEERSGVTFTLHDLRRTFRSGLTDLEVQNDVAEVCIGHLKEKLVRIYDKAEGRAQVSRAFKAWSNHVARLIVDDAAERAVNRHGMLTLV